jgi:hypothetical protein
VNSGNKVTHLFFRLLLGDLLIQKFQGNPDDVKKRSAYTYEKIQINVKEILLISLTFENKVIEQLKWKLSIGNFILFIHLTILMFCNSVKVKKIKFPQKSDQLHMF